MLIPLFVPVGTHSTKFTSDLHRIIRLGFEASRFANIGSVNDCNYSTFFNFVSMEELKELVQCATK